MNKPKIIAHRGASGQCPENTAAAFQRALMMGAEGIELDVHLSADSHLVVIHDAQVDRTSNGKGWVKDLALKELKALDFGAWFHPSFTGETLLTLSEVLDLLGDWQGLLNIELKSGPILYEGLEEKVIRMVKEYDRLDSVILSSFNHYSLKAAKALEPAVSIGLLYMAGLVDPWVYAQRMDAQAIHPYYHGVVPLITAGCQACGIAVHPFTVNESAAIRALAGMGVNAIITDLPDVAREALKGL